MGTISKVLSGGSAVVAGSAGTSFYAGKAVGSSKTPIQNELNKLKDNFTNLFQTKSLKDTKPEDEVGIVNNITQARKCTNYMWPGLKVGDPNSSVVSDIKGGCLHIDLKYSQERSILAHIELTLSDGQNGIIFGGQIAPSRNDFQHIEFFWWRMNVDKETNGKWKIKSGASVRHNVKFGYVSGGIYNSISFKSYFFDEPFDTVVDLFRMCNRTSLSAGKSKTSKNCDFAKDYPDLWANKTKTYKWDMTESVNGQSTNRHVTEVFDIRLNNNLDKSSLIWGIWWRKVVEGKNSDTEESKPNEVIGGFTHYMTNGKWEECVKGKHDSQCQNRTRQQLWGNWSTKEGVKKASKVLYKQDEDNVDRSALKSF